MASKKDRVIKIMTPDGEKTIRFMSGREAGDEEHFSFCQENCKYANCCENLPNPDLNTPGDNLMDFCIAQDNKNPSDQDTLMNTYYPVNIEKYIPNFMDKVLKSDPRFSLNDIHSTICREFCSLYSEAGITDECSEKNPMCVLQALLIRNKTKNDD